MYKRKQLCAWVSVSVCKLVCMCISGRVCVFMKSMLRVGILAPVWHCLTSFPATSGSSGGGHGFCGGGEGGGVIQPLSVTHPNSLHSQRPPALLSIACCHFDPMKTCIPGIKIEHDQTTTNESNFIHVKIHQLTTQEQSQSP